MQPRAFFFDLDDTLIDRAGAFARYLEDVFSRYPAVFPPERRESDRAQLLALDRRGYTERGLFCQQATLAFPALPLSPEALWEDILSRLPGFIQPQPEIHALVQWAKARGPVAMVSNGSSRMQRAKLARAGLEGLLPAVFLSGEVGASKPDPRLFAAALTHVGLPPAEVLHVGDDPLRDIAGAAGAGLASCWVSHGRDWPRELTPPTFVVNHVTALIQVLPARR